METWDHACSSPPPEAAAAVVAAAPSGRPASTALPVRPPGRTHTCPLVGEGGPQGRLHPTQAETDNPFPTQWGLCPAAGLHSLSLLKPHGWVLAPGPSESLPQAPEAFIEGASLCSKAFFVLWLASLHNPLLPSPLQTQVLPALGPRAVSHTGVGQWMPPGKWGGCAEIRSLLSRFLCPCPLRVLSLSLTAPEAGAAPTSLPRWCSLDVCQEVGWAGSAHSGWHQGELLNWPLTLPLRQREASLAQTIAVSSLPLLVLPFLGLPRVPCPGGGVQEGNSAKCLGTQLLVSLLSLLHLPAPARQTTSWVHWPGLVSSCWES